MNIKLPNPGSNSIYPKKKKKKSWDFTLGGIYTGREWSKKNIIISVLPVHIEEMKEKEGKWNLSSVLLMIKTELKRPAYKWASRGIHTDI